MTTLLAEQDQPVDAGRRYLREHGESCAKLTDSGDDLRAVESTPEMSPPLYVQPPRSQAPLRVSFWRGSLLGSQLVRLGPHLFFAAARNPGCVPPKPAGDPGLQGADGVWTASGDVDVAVEVGAVHVDCWVEFGNRLLLWLSCYGSSRELCGFCVASVHDGPVNWRNAQGSAHAPHVFYVAPDLDELSGVYAYDVDADGVNHDAQC